MNHFTFQMSYSYRYSIDQPPVGLTPGVIMDRWEERRGNEVSGGYGMVEPNGNIRTVYYEVTAGRGLRMIMQSRPPINQLQFINHHHRTSSKLKLTALQQPRTPYQHQLLLANVL